MPAVRIALKTSAALAAVLFAGVAFRAGPVRSETLAPVKAIPDTARSQADVDDFYRSHEATFRSGRLPQTAEEKALFDELDARCGQKDCYASKLFWHRDFEAAKADSKRLKRPILALHMLGNLTDERSCANSRFFRAILYSDPQIASYLRDHYVLYWRSVRPVPQVTIDYGDGRKIHQTLTGNSIHYLLASDGSVVDALPGLYAPKVFLDQLQKFADHAPWADGSEEAVRKYQTDRVGSSYGELLVLSDKRIRTRKAEGAAPPTLLAEQLAVSKSSIETRVLRGIGAPRATEELERLRTVQQAILIQPKAEELLSPESRAFIALHNPKLAPKAFDTFLRSVLADTRLNEGEQRLLVLGWMIEDPKLRELSKLNEQVYDLLFKTPSSDPWLGLDPNGVYSALSASGNSDEPV